MSDKICYRTDARLIWAGEHVEEVATPWRCSSLISCRAGLSIYCARNPVAHSASIHLEQMPYDQWFMGSGAGGKYFHLNFAVRDGKLYVHLSDQGEEYAEWEGDNRERPFPGTAA